MSAVWLCRPLCVAARTALGRQHPGTQRLQRAGILQQHGRSSGRHNGEGQEQDQSGAKDAPPPTREPRRLATLTTLGPGHASTA
jgi:hypothetical protein